MGTTFAVSKLELKRSLTVMGVSQKGVEELLSQLNKMRRHVNVVAFAGMLQKVGLNADDAANVLRRIGIDDITIASVFNVLDEERIKSTYGRIVEIAVTS